MREDTVDSWLSSLSERTPAPGGGAAAALAAATSAALIGMVSSYTTGERYADRSEQMQALSDQAQELRSRALDLAQADAEAFAKVGEAYRLRNDGQGGGDARKRAIQDALVGAAEPPLQVAALASEILTLAEGLVESGNPNVIADVGVASSMARAAIESASLNVEVNAALIEERDVQGRLNAEVERFQQLLNRADATTAAVRQAITPK